MLSGAPHLLHEIRLLPKLNAISLTVGKFNHLLAKKGLERA